MGSTVRIEEPLGVRMATLPLVLGGEGSDIIVPSASATGLTLEERGGQWLAKPAPDAALTLNGLPLLQPAALDAGDVIGIGAAQVIVQPARGDIDVRHLAGNATVAPLRQDVLPGDEIVAGVREIFAADSAATQAATVASTAARRSARWVLAAAVLVAAALGALLFSLVPVPLQLQPAGVTVKSSGIFDWHAGDRIFVLPGRRELTFSQPGYREQSLALQVTRELGSAEPLAIALVKLPDEYTIDTGGITAELLVDGVVVGKLPGAAAVEAGSHELVVRAPKFVDYVLRQQVEGGGNKHQLKVQLQPAMGWLVLDTQPATARVSIDGQDVGSPPMRVELDAGLRRLVIASPGRRSWNSEVAIIAGETLDLGRIDLASPPPAPPPRVVAESPEAAATPTAAIDAKPAAPPRPPSPARVNSALLGTLVLLPAGKYQQGSDRREQGRRSNESLREVTLTRAFYLAANEVTNAQFRAFRADHVSGIALEKSLDLDQQAVSNVSWNDAVEFCNWLSLRESLPAAYERRDGRWQLISPLNRGYRLPTEAEWEYAARYVDGQRWQRYPWGDALPPPANAANLGGTESLPPRQAAEARLASSLPDYRDEHAVIAPVGSYARSALGLHDMAGNVSEWMHDVYVSLPDSQPVTDPMGATIDGLHSFRGTNWRTATIAELRPAWRERAPAPSQMLGFRVARFAEDAQ